MRSLGTFVLWLAATIGATAVAWQAVDAVGVAASGEVSGTVVATIVPRSAETPESPPPNPVEDPAPPTTSASTPGSTAAPDPTASTTAAPPAGPTSQPSATLLTSPTTTTTGAPTSSTAPTSSSPTTTTTGAPTAPPPTTPPPTTPPPTTTSAPVPFTQTFGLIGGSVTVLFSPSSVEVLLAEPAVDFSVDVRQKNPTEIEVRFDNAGTGHRSRLRAWWAGGPVSQIQD